MDPPTIDYECGNEIKECANGCCTFEVWEEGSSTVLYAFETKCAPSACVAHLKASFTTPVVLYEKTTKTWPMWLQHAL